MKFIRTSILIFFLCLTGSALAENSFAQLDQLLSTFKSMSANFQQSAIVKKNTGKKSTGTMALQRPGKFRWEITSPNHQVIIADGKYLWIYDVDLEQATKQNLNKDPNSPAILLSGSTAALEQRFEIVDSNQSNNESFFRLKPKNNQDMVQFVELQFVDEKLKQMSVVDKLGQKNIFYFSDVRVNPKLAPALFQFKAPKGVDIIDN